jgi:hypothetical protein
MNLDSPADVSRRRGCRFTPFLPCNRGPGDALGQRPPRRRLAVGMTWWCALYPLWFLFSGQGGWLTAVGVSGRPQCPRLLRNG